MREWLDKKLKSAHIKTIEVERSPDVVHVILKTSRPGILIGRGGEGSEKLKTEIEKKLLHIAKQFKQPIPAKREVRLTIEEIRAPETHAAIAAQIMTEDLEKRVPFRRVMKMMLEKITASKEVKGVKIALKGRLDGAEMARYEWTKKGRIPLQTMRADIDYAEKTAHTTYGTVGVKVWVYKGDIFADKSQK